MATHYLHHRHRHRRRQDAAYGTVASASAGERLPRVGYEAVLFRRYGRYCVPPCRSGGRIEPGRDQPVYFPEPIAPLLAARKHYRNIRLGDVLTQIRRVARRSECLLIEGSGGLLVPLGEGYRVADLIRQLDCKVLVAARNRLGTINHTLLTVQALQHIGIQRVKVVLMSENSRDFSSRSNGIILPE